MGRLKYSERTLSDNSILRLLQSPTKGRLGPLEWQVLSFLWQRGSATVKEVVEYGDIRREYNTVMTTLDRLYRKRLADRTPEPNSRAFRYIPRHRNQGEWHREVVIQTVSQLLNLGTTASLPLSYLVDAISEHNAGLLDDLRRLLDEKRQKLRSEH